MEMADEISTHSSSLPPCQVEPVEDAVRRVACETGHSPQTIALTQEGQGFGHH